MNYNESARLGLERYQKDRDALLLAIESSCDETAASVLRGPREVVSMSVYTQIPLHRRFGGVVPELAARSHVEKVGSVVADALEKAGGAAVVLEQDASGQTLFQTACGILHDGDRRSAMERAMASLGIRDATKRLYDTVMSIRK